MSMFSITSSRSARLGHGRFERIEVDHDQVDRADLVFGHRGGVLGIVAHGQQPAVDHRVQRLDPAVHHLGKAGQFGNVLYRQPASRSALAVPPVETSSTPRAASAWPRSTSPVLSDTESSARRIVTSSCEASYPIFLSSQAKLPPPRETSPWITSCCTGCGRPWPSTQMLSSIVTSPAGAELPVAAIGQRQPAPLSVFGQPDSMWGQGGSGSQSRPCRACPCARPAPAGPRRAVRCRRRAGSGCGGGQAIALA
jgi:hypothetical protein